MPVTEILPCTRQQAMPPESPSVFAKDSKFTLHPWFSIPVNRVASGDMVQGPCLLLRWEGRAFVVHARQPLMVWTILESTGQKTLGIQKVAVPSRQLISSPAFQGDHRMGACHLCVISLYAVYNLREVVQNKGGQCPGSQDMQECKAYGQVVLTRASPNTALRKLKFSSGKALIFLPAKLQNYWWSLSSFFLP